MSQIITYPNKEGFNIEYTLPEGIDVKTFPLNQRLRKVLVIGLGCPVDVFEDEWESSYDLIEELTPIEQLQLIDEYSRMTGLNMTAIIALNSAIQTGSGDGCCGFTYDTEEVGEGFEEYIRDALRNSIFKDHFIIEHSPSHLFIEISVAIRDEQDEEFDKIYSLFTFIEDLNMTGFITYLKQDD